MSSNSKHQAAQPLQYLQSFGEEQSLAADNEDYRILQKLEPQMTNSKGQIVVEVEKVLKDLQVLYRAMIASKFFKLCIQSTLKPTDLPPDALFAPPTGQEQVVKHYRDLQNFIFKLIVKLNNGAEQLERGDNEVYRLKLLNQELREEAWRHVKKETSRAID